MTHNGKVFLYYRMNTETASILISSEFINLHMYVILGWGSLASVSLNLLDP